MCVAFDVDNALPDPTLDIYLPEGFRSGGCPFEANATLFPECLGELPAPSLDAISCKEMWDGRMLSYYLHISVAGMANASGFAGYALQLDLRAPRIMPRANIWKLDMRSSDHKAAKLHRCRHWHVRWFGTCLGWHGFACAEWGPKHVTEASLGLCRGCGGLRAGRMV